MVPVAWPVASKTSCARERKLYKPDHPQRNLPRATVSPALPTTDFSPSVHCVLANGPM